MTDTPMTDKLVKAGGRAIQEELPYGGGETWDELTPERRDLCLRSARAALTAALAEIEGAELAKRIRGREFLASDLNEAADALDLLTAGRERDRALLGELEAEVEQYIGDLKHARDGWDAAEARAERMETAIHFNCHILQQVRDILHAHNRPDQPLNNEMRLSCRASIDGVIRRLSVALARKREPDDD